MTSIADKRRNLWKRWLNRRIPPVSALALSHRNVFILPSRTGWAFAALLVAMLLTAINYQNSLIYGLTFWLVSVGHGTIWLTFRNLSGLTLSAGKPTACFAGDEIRLPVKFTSGKHWSAAISAGYPEETQLDLSLAPHESSEMILTRKTHKRGRLPLKRIRVETQYPFGLFTAWSWVALEYDVVVYPRPDYSPLVLSTGNEGDILEGVTVTQGSDDVAGIRDYGRGDSMQQISWKHSARTGDLKSLEREQENSVLCWLTWDSLQGIDPELRLSRLASWVDQAESAGWKYGLSIPGNDISPSSGHAHRHQCLTALAIWGQD